MGEEVWAVIKYKPKEGCDDEFREGLRRLAKLIADNHHDPLCQGSCPLLYFSLIFRWAD